MSDKIIHAVIKLGSKQYLVKAGDKIVAEKISGNAGDTFKIAEVLLITDGENTEIGAPFVEKASVELKLESQAKAEKIRVAKFRAKSRYRKVTGHRQQITNLLVTAINK